MNHQGAFVPGTVVRLCNDATHAAVVVMPVIQAGEERELRDVSVRVVEFYDGVRVTVPVLQLREWT